MDMTPKGEDVIYSWDSYQELVMFPGSTLFGAKVRGSSPFLTLPWRRDLGVYLSPVFYPSLGSSLIIAPSAVLSSLGLHLMCHAVWMWPYP